MARESEAARRRRFETEALPHLPALYNAALRMTRNAADAEDLVQETFLRAHRFWDRYQAGTHCKAWLFKILTNTHINAYVKRSKQPAAVDFDVVEPSLAQPESDSWDGDFADLWDDEVKAALEQLPDDFRIVLILAVIEGFAYREVAQILDIPIGTVMSRLFRARKLMRRHLHDYAKRRGLVRDPQGDP